MKVPLDLQINNHFAVVNSMGQAVLVETLKAAAYYVTHSNGTRSHAGIQFKEAMSCYAFVQGTGLNIIINRFGLAYNAEKIQDAFNYCVRKSA